MLIKKARCAVLMSILAFLPGCVSLVSYDGVSYDSREKAIAALIHDRTAGIERVSPLEKPLATSGTIFIPSKEYIGENGVRSNGPLPSDLRQGIVEMESIMEEGLAKALEKKKLFAETIISTYDVQPSPQGNFIIMKYDQQRKFVVAGTFNGKALSVSFDPATSMGQKRYVQFTDDVEASIRY